jgi:pimeloyl-ACP methyl ester carboxylesterase
MLTNTMKANGIREISKDITAYNSPILFVETGGRKLAYRSIGTGEPMIVCNRFRGTMDDWDPAFIDALAENYRVINFDYTGYSSSTGTANQTITGFANDVKDLAEALGLQKILLCGWSFGGLVAQTATVEYPELISQTILLGTKPPGEVTYGFEDIFFQTALKPVNDLDDEIILFFEPLSAISREAAKACHERIARRTIDRDILVDPALWQFYLAAGKEYQEDVNNSREKLMNTKIPILVISGDHEICFPPGNWFELIRKLPTTQLVVIPQTGHGPQQQYPGMVAAYIHAFISNNIQNKIAN